MSFEENEVDEVEVVHLPVLTAVHVDHRPAFHPHLVLSFNTSPSHLSQSYTLADQSALSRCKLDVHISLPDILFLDREELKDALHDLEWSLSPSTIDIERAVRPLEPLSHLAFSVHVGAREQLDIPLHARYPRPSQSGYEVVTLFEGGRTGQVGGYWDCGSRAHEFQFLAEPSLNLTLPTGRPSDQPIVQLGTTAAVWLCFAYLAYKLYYTSQRLSSRLTAPKHKTL